MAVVCHEYWAFCFVVIICCKYTAMRGEVSIVSQIAF